MSEKNLSQEFRLKNIDETRNYFIKEINQNELMSKKCKKVCNMSNYIEYLLILISTVTGCVSISTFASLRWYSYRNYEFYSRIKNLSNNWRN